MRRANKARGVFLRVEAVSGYGLRTTSGGNACLIEECRAGATEIASRQDRWNRVAGAYLKRGLYERREDFNCWSAECGGCSRDGLRGSSEPRTERVYYSQPAPQYYAQAPAQPNYSYTTPPPTAQAYPQYQQPQRYQSSAVQQPAISGLPECGAATGPAYAPAPGQVIVLDQQQLDQLIAPIACTRIRCSRKC